MMILCVIFIPPVYLLIRHKWGGFCINAVLYLIACSLVLSLIGIMAAPIFWLLAVCHAGFYLRRETAERNAEMFATKLAEKMRPGEPPVMRQ